MHAPVARVYVAAASLLAFFVLWATIAARPWAAAAARPSVDPRLTALAKRQQQLRHEAAEVQRLVSYRWRVYRHRLRAREQEIAAVRREHERELAAARAAAARIAAAEAVAAARAATAAPVSSVPGTPCCTGGSGASGRRPGDAGRDTAAAGACRDAAAGDQVRKLAAVIASLQRSVFPAMAVKDRVPRRGDH